MSETAATAQPAEAVRLAVGLFARGVVSPAVLWDELTAVLTPAQVASVLGSLPADQQAILREVFDRWPRALRSEGRDDEVRRALERWCQACPPPAVQPERQAEPAVDFPMWTAPRPPVGPPFQPAAEAPPQDELAPLRACYREYGYVRRPRTPSALGGDREWEVRFVMRYKYEMTRTQQILQQAGFSPDEPFRRYGFHWLSVPGRVAVERLLALVGGRGLEAVAKRGAGR